MGQKGPSEGGVKTPGGMDLRGPGGPSRGGDPPLGGSKRAKKWQSKGVPLVCHLGPCKFPMKNGLAGQILTPPGGSSGGPPPSGGGFLAPPGLVGGGSPPRGGPRGPKRAKKGPF